MTNTSERAYRYRPADHLAGQAYHKHGALLPMAQERAGVFRRLFGRERRGRNA